MQRKILIVDDNKMNRIMLRGILQEKYAVIEAVNGEDALRILEESHATLSAMMLDLSMPVLDGYQVLERMGKDPQLSQVPAIVTTGSEDSNSEMRALALGAQDYVLKPYKPEIILHRLKNIIKLRETSATVSALQHDRLTGLLNREAFLEQADKLIHRHKSGYYVMTCFNINNFKVINDLYGSEKGDDVLRQLAEIFKSGFDNAGGLASRIMADNFAVLYPANLIGTEKLEHIRQAASVLDGSIAPISFSIGRYIVNDLSLSVSAMYDRAIIAEMSVKGRYDGNIGIYNETMRETILNEQAIITEMKQALATGQFEAWYQPQYNHSTGALVGAEALVRWRHPKMGLISPGVFIPVFERNGFIYELDKYILEQVCALLRRRMDEGVSPLPISVNLSRYDVFQDDLISVIMGLLKKYSIPTSLLRLEITESAFSKSVDQITSVVKELIALGFTVEIDDFGSGYSSLNTLKNVPAQIVKLDMKFLEGDDDSGRGGNIIESVVRMVKWLGMTLIAEGVETIEQADYLKSIGCNYVQGYLYARPLPEADYVTLVSSACKEEKTIAMQAVDNLDNNAFWNPKSLDSLIFNSYVGGACILEFWGGKIEILRATERYLQMLGSSTMSVEDVLKLDWAAHMDAENLQRFSEAIMKSMVTKQDVNCEYELCNLPGCTEKVYLRTVLRVIATIGSHCLIYCLNENITSQREAEESRLAAIQKVRDADEQLRFLNDVAHNLLAQPEIEVGIDNVLHKILNHFGAERAYIIEYNENRRISKNTYEVCAPGVKSEMARLQDVPSDAYHFWFETFNRGEFISIEDVAALQESRREERELLNEQGIRRLIAIPFQRNGKLIGFIGVDDPSRHQSHVDQLLAVADYLVVMLTRRDLTAKITSDNKIMQALMDDTPGGFARMRMKPDGQLSTVYVNESFCRMRGMTAEQILTADGENALVAIHPDDKDSALAALRRMLETGKKEHVVYRLLHADGSYIAFNAFGSITKNESNELFINIYYAELTSQEKKNYSMRETMPFILSAIMDSSTDLSFAKDKDFVYICCSQPFAQMAGFENKADIVGKTDYELFDKDTADRFRADDLKLFESGRALVDYLEPIPSTDGMYHYSSTSKYILRDSMGNVVGMYGIGRDVTDTRTAFEQLKLLTDSISGGLATYAVSPEGVRITYFNDGFCKMLGYTREEYEKSTEVSITNITFAEDVPLIMAQVEELKRNGTPLDCIYRIHRRDGGFRWVHLRGNLSERVGDTLYVNIILFDIDDQKAAEESLRIHQEEIKFAMSRMGNVIAEYDIQSHTLYMPDNYSNKYGYDEVIQNVPESMKDIYKMDDEVFSTYRDFYESILRGKTPSPIEIQKKAADGTVRWERLMAYLVFSDTGIPLKALVTGENTTEQHMAYELEQNRPMLGEDNLLVHALFDLNTGETLDYAYQDGSEVPKAERTAFLVGSDNLNEIIIDDVERRRYRELNDASALLDRYARGETEFSMDYRRKIKTGEVIWVKNILRMIRKPGCDNILLFEYCYNIEEEKTLELMYSKLVSENFDYVARINGNTRQFAIIANSGVSYCVPPQRGDDMDATTRELTEQYVHPDDREIVLKNTLVEGIKKNLESNDYHQFNCRTVRPDGEIRYKKFTASYLDRERYIIVLTREDVSSAVQREMHKNEQLAAALNAANQASRAKSDFLSRMSHELRTPMNAIIGLSALSASEMDDRARIEDNIGKIGMSARYLLSLINDILEMSRIESGRMTLSEAPFDFDKFISGVNTIIYEQAQTKGLDYDVVVQGYTEPIYVGDEIKLQEILINVLGNAVKFTPAGGKVKLTIEQLQRAKGRAGVRFIVADTGTGIKDEFLPHLFEPFAQESTSFVSTATGTGLGLAITKNLVEMMNGQIQVKSIKNIGSVFTIDVQLGVSGDSQRYLDRVASMNLSHIRTLVVDDDITVCKSTQKTLRTMGIQAQWADSGRQAVECVKKARQEKHDFNAIFVDWKMPDMDGIETTQQIRKIVGPNVTIVVMTAYDWRSIEAEARKAGVDMLIEKPLFQSSVVKAFEKVFMASKGDDQKPPEKPDFTGKRVLMVEDNLINAEVLKRILESVGMEVTVANNGLEALKAFTNKPDNFFDIILMDVRMPEMDGLTAAKNIRKLKRAGSKTIPIVAVTANAFEEDLQLSLASGMNEHLAKPIDPPTLFSMLNRLLKPNKLQRVYKGVTK